MLFHVTATHTVDDCPGYHHEKMPAILEGAEKMDDLAKQFNVKVHFLLNGAPEHVFYALLEAENNYSLANFLLESLRFQQDFKVTPVQPLAETIAMAKEMMARAGG